MIAAIALLPAAAPALAAPPPTPVALFEAACAAGSVALPRGTAAALPCDKLPQAGREALGLAVVGTRSGGVLLSVTTLRDRTVPKSVPEAEAPFPGAN